MENRPTLNRVWSSSGQNIRDPGDDKYAAGWVAEIPTSEVFNFLQNKIDKTFLAIGERGIPEWGSDVSYKQGALVWDEVDGLVYVALAENPDSKTSPNLNALQWAKSSVQISRVEFDALNSKISEHIAQHGESNPHQLTPHDVGTYTKQEIDAMCSANDDTNNAHIADMNNPHEDTAEKIGAVPVTGGTYEGPITLAAGVTELNAEGTAMLDASSDVLNITVNAGGLGIDADGTPGIIKDGEGFVPFGTAAVANIVESNTDETVGRVPVVGWMGWGGNALSEGVGGVGDLTELPEFTSSAVREYTTNDGSVYMVGVGGKTGNGNFAEWLAPENGGDGTKIAVRNKDYLFTLYSNRNKPTANDVGALPLTGGTMSGEITGKYTGGKGWGDQYASRAPFYDSVATTTTTSEYWPSIKQKFTISGTASYSYVWSMGALVNATSTPNITLQSKGSAGQEQKWTFDISTGQFIPASYSNFDARFQAKGSYYTTTQSDARYVQDVRLLGRTWVSHDGNIDAPAGCVFVSGGDFGSDNGGYAYAALQKKVNNNWYTVAHN